MTPKQRTKTFREKIWGKDNAIIVTSDCVNETKTV